MAIKQIFIYLLILNCQHLFAQLEVIDININKSNSAITVIADTIFYIEKKTIIDVTYKGDGKLEFVTNSEGKIRNLHHGQFEVSFPQTTNSEATILKFYEKTPKNKTKLLELKTFHLRHIPAPIISIGGVENDSAINIEHLIRDNIVRASHPNNNQNLRVLDYYIKFTKEDSSYVQGNKMPISLKNKIYNQTEGSTITLYNIRTIMPDQSIYITKSMNIFMIINDQYSVGNRKYIQK
jgi:hypothetical protein